MVEHMSWFAQQLRFPEIEPYGARAVKKNFSDVADSQYVTETEFRLDRIRSHAGRERCCFAIPCKILRPSAKCAKKSVWPPNMHCLDTSPK